ncbi:MAG: sigma 54-interacting transcriptional regulator [Desulfomonilaceae bacterium]
MGLRSLKTKILLAVSALVITSGMLLSFLVSNQYSHTLIESAMSQAENMAHALALEATDKILTHDLVSLQKSLDHQLRSNKAISYLFIIKDGKIIAHTFGGGFPENLIEANQSVSADQGAAQKIVSSKGEKFIDIAWPIFGGKAGVLRLGFSESHLEQQVSTLRLQMMLTTAGILIAALVGALVFVRRLTLPLGQLAKATESLKDGDWDVKVNVSGKDEVALLASSFDSMAKKLRDNTQLLEFQKQELERLHLQTRSFCDIVRELGASPSLEDLSRTLIRRLKEVVHNDELAILFLNDGRDLLFTITENGFSVTRDSKAVTGLANIIERLHTFQVREKHFINCPLIPDSFEKAHRQVLLPIRAVGKSYGLLVIACSPSCKCDHEEMSMINLILEHAGGVIKRSLDHEETLINLQQRLEAGSEFSGIIGKDSKMQLLFRLIEDIAPTDATVLIQGESGSGKELVARAIHDKSYRSEKPFVVINCSAYPETLLESELFGHEKGAFTGAIRQKPGRFEQADGGTVFLDEIGEITPQAQVKLLRVLQTQRFERIGADKSISVNVRILAATNKNLLQEVQNGSFREDLFYRLNVIPITLPPLRDRRNDIPLLAAHFMKRFNSIQEKNISVISHETMRILTDYSWPGNVRELENTIEHAVVRCKGSSLEPGDLPTSVRSKDLHSINRPIPNLSENERSLLERALLRNRGNKKKTAEELGIGRSTLYSKLRRYGLDKTLIQ